MKSRETIPHDFDLFKRINLTRSCFGTDLKKTFLHLDA